MKKIALFFVLHFSIIVFAQKQDIENGTYIAKSNGQTIKLILSDDKNFDVTFLSGKYETKNDSIFLGSNNQKKEAFNLIYHKKTEVPVGKIKIEFSGKNFDFNYIYFATYNGSAEPSYKRVSEVLEKNEQYINLGSTDFEIDKADFLVLAKENYQGETRLHTYKLNDQITKIEVNENYGNNEELKLSGVYNKASKSFTISENTRNPLVFLPENQVKQTLDDTVLPTDFKKINNFTYSGKDKYIVNAAKLAAGESETASDSISGETTEPKKISLKIENNLNAALQTLISKPDKFLVIYYDPKNAKATTQFNDFIITQNADINYNMYSGYDAKFDLYDYYLASKADLKWLKNKGIKKFPCTVIINSEGEIISKANKSITDLSAQFNYYNEFNAKLKRVNTLLNFNKAMSKKQTDLQSIKAFYDLTNMQIPPEYIIDDAQQVAIDAEAKINNVRFVPPVVVKEIDASVTNEKSIEEVKVDPEPAVEIVEAPPAIEEAAYENKIDFNVFTKLIFDKKLVEQTWKNIIEAHKTDIQPNIELALVIIKELNGEGFTKQLFNQEKLPSATNFDALDYVFKHFNAIEEARIKSNYKEDVIHNLDLLKTEIYKILTGAVRLIKPQTPMVTQQKIVSYYKKLITIDVLNDNLKTSDYFELLKNIAVSSKSETQYIQEYDSYFSSMFEGKSNVFEKLDTLFTEKTNSTYESWSEFKTSYSNLSNDAAWFVVENSKNPESIKKAIKWSENSFLITKNNHYYLDTLARLYYMNGDRNKAIATQQLAIDNNFDDANEYKAVLEKMKNGTF